MNNQIIEMVEINDNYFIPKNTVERNKHGMFRLDKIDYNDLFRISEDRPKAKREDYPESGFKDYLCW